MATCKHVDYLPIEKLPPSSNSSRELCIVILPASENREFELYRDFAKAASHLAFSSIILSNTQSLTSNIIVILVYRREVDHPTS